MKRLHVALAVSNLDESISDYNSRLESEPVCVVPGIYALWLTPLVNLSISVKPNEAPGTLRHLGIENPNSPKMSIDTDCNNLVWEEFSVQQQKDEIFSYWPNAEYHDV